MGGEGDEGGALGQTSTLIFPLCTVSQEPRLLSEAGSVYFQGVHCLCSPHLMPQHSLSSRFQELEKLGLGDSVDLHVYEIPVEYKTVQRLIPALWEKHSPQVSGAKAGAASSGPAGERPTQG